MAAFFYTKNKQKHGPISAAELKRLAETGQLQATDQVLKEGTSKWLAAGSIKGLFPDNRPEAIAAAVERPGTRGRLLLGVAVVALAGLAGAGYLFYGGGAAPDQGSAGDKTQANKDAATSQTQTAQHGDAGAKSPDAPAAPEIDPASPETAARKMAAWKAFVAEFTLPIDEDARDAHLEKCEKLLNDYLAVPIDHHKFTKEAKEITQEYRRRTIASLYPAWPPIKRLNAEVQTITTDLLKEEN